MISTRRRTLRGRARRFAADRRREAAIRDAQRRVEDMRDVLADRADTLGEVAEERLEQARDATAPKVEQLRRKAADALDTDINLDRIRAELADASAQVGQNLVKVGLDLKAATKDEADRIITTLHESAEEARRQERRKRVRALVGWTVFGMAAGAVLAWRFGPNSDDPTPEEADAILHTITDDPASQPEEEQPEGQVGSVNAADPADLPGRRQP